MQVNAWIPIGIAVGTVIVVPTAVWIGRKIAAAWHAHRIRLLGEVFVTRAEFKREFEKLGDTGARQHRENQHALEALRMDGKEREGKITAMLDGARKDVKDEARLMASSVGEVHKRVDSILHMLGNRRRD